MCKLMRVQLLVFKNTNICTGISLESGSYKLVSVTLRIVDRKRKHKWKEYGSTDKIRRKHVK